MASEAARRAAGATGAGDGEGNEDAVIGGEGEKKKRGKRGDRSESNKPEVQAKILQLDVLEYTIERDGKKATLFVRATLTIGDILQRRALEDIDSYAKLILLEGAKLSPIDYTNNPLRILDNDGVAYLKIAILRSNARALLRDILTKIAYVEDPDGNKVRLNDSDYEQLETAQVQEIGEVMVSRWLLRYVEQLQAKNRQRMAQA